MLDPELERALVERFTDYVMRVARLPEAQRTAVEQAPDFHVVDGEIRCTCGITGSTYSAVWDGSDETARHFADEAAHGTVLLVTRTPYYAWLRSRVSGV